MFPINSSMCGNHTSFSMTDKIIQVRYSLWEGNRVVWKLKYSKQSEKYIFYKFKVIYVSLKNVRLIIFTITLHGLKKWIQIYYNTIIQSIFSLRNIKMILNHFGLKEADAYLWIMCEK